MSRVFVDTELLAAWTNIEGGWGGMGPVGETRYTHSQDSDCTFILHRDSKETLIVKWVAVLLCVYPRSLRNLAWYTSGIRHIWLGTHLAWDTSCMGHIWLGTHLAWDTSGLEHI